MRYRSIDPHPTLAARSPQFSQWASEWLKQWLSRVTIPARRQTKRVLAQLVAAATLVLALGCSGGNPSDFRSSWPENVERVWVGPDYWSNPMQDWRVRAGRLELVAAGGDRNVFLLTREVSAQPGDLAMSVHLGRMEQDTTPLEEGFAGFRVGIRGSFNDYRDSAVRGYGLHAGLSSDGSLFIAKLEESNPKVPGAFEEVELRLRAEPAGSNYRVVLEAYSGGEKAAEVSRDDVPSDWLEGGLTLVCSSGEVEETPPPHRKVLEPDFGGKPGTQRGGTLRFWFKDWTVSGSKVTAHEDRAFGPILFAMHTLSRKVLKLTAQMAPIGNAPRNVWLETRDTPESEWRQMAETTIDPQARTARFRMEDWDDTKDTPYRVACAMPNSAGQSQTYYWEGTVRRDPAGKEQIVVAAFTGNNDLGFPHADIVEHVSHFKPDLLAYTGDNIYERVAEYGVQRSPVDASILDYLRKWYLFGWEYRELLKEIPAVALPDDHDVYQGNIWGTGGRHAEGTGYAGQDKGGYTMSAEFVNVVQRTQTSNLPDPYDPAPIDQGINVAYTSLLYGGVSFAIVEDRKWKSAPTEVLPRAEIINGWARNPRWNAATQSDVPGTQLLGDRQLEFLNEWAVDWSGGAWMKALISQTIFANVATLPKGTRSDAITSRLKVMEPGEYAQGEAPVQDHDSNGWPQTGRNKALRAIRRGLALHIAGDQHLGSTIQYGIDNWNDAGWAICVPSVANIFPRRWFPPQPGRNRKPVSPRNTGEYRDGFGNRITVHAVSNPIANGVEPTALHHRAPGYGIISIDRATRNITFANWPRWVNPAEPGAKPYDGWPITVSQLDNGFPGEGLTLGTIESPDVSDPVIQVIDQSSGEIVYSLRIQGKSFEPKVRRAGVYTVKVLDPDEGYEKIHKDLRASP